MALFAISVLGTESVENWAGPSVFRIQNKGAVDIKRRLSSRYRKVPQRFL